jgi:sulfur carrier protein ThiS
MMNPSRNRRAISNDPNYMHPDAPDLPKRITLHRADAFATAQNQTVIINPDREEGHSSAPKPGPMVHHALKAAYVPAGYVLVSPMNGEVLDPEDHLYSHVNDGDVVEVVKA